MHEILTDAFQILASRSEGNVSLYRGHRMARQRFLAASLRPAGRGAASGEGIARLVVEFLSSPVVFDGRPPP